MVGSLVGLVGTLLGFYLTIVASESGNAGFAFLIFLVAWALLLFFPHCLAHYLVGRLVGVSFTHYTLAKSGIAKLDLNAARKLGRYAVVLSLRIERKSLNRVSPGGRAAMFYSGALASMILPFISPVSSLGRLPITLSLLLLALSLANAAFDIYYSPRVGDISRARK